MDSQAVNETIGLVQKVIKLGKKATNLDYEEALLAARETIAAQRDENLRLKEDNYGLRVENDKLKTQHAIEKNVEFARGAYWHRGPSKWEGPFCNACWVNRSKLVPLTFRDFGNVVWDCPSCKASYGHDVKRRHPQDDPPVSRVEGSPIHNQ